jgi:hypothetical protein
VLAVGVGGMAALGNELPPGLHPESIAMIMAAETTEIIVKSLITIIGAQRPPSINQPKKNIPQPRSTSATTPMTMKEKIATDTQAIQ